LLKLIKVDMKNVLKINPYRPQKKIINFASDIIKKGGVVAFPTETVYGLGVDATNDQAIKKIFKLKKRPADNPLIVHISSMSQLNDVAAEIPAKAAKLIEKYWPGPLTLVFKKNKIISKIATCNLDTVAVRMPENKIALGLINSSQTPIAAPSANISGKPSPTKAGHVLEDLGTGVDLILDGGQTKIGIESTVLDMSEKRPMLLRRGAISQIEIEDTLGESILLDKNQASKPKSPGMKYTHYSPHAEVILVKGDRRIQKMKSLAENLQKNNKRTAIITFTENENFYKDFNVKALCKKNDLKSYSKKIFSVFRDLDRDGVDVILVEEVPLTGIGIAIDERLSKAANNIINT